MDKTRQAPQLIIAFFSGVLFAVGLIVSQMVNPAKILNFLDLAGDWDPTLIFVMGGAVFITLPMFWLVLKRPAPLFARKFYLPTRRDIDSRLIGGSAIFGIGWGVAGFCPGPSITALATGLWPVFVFVAAMASGALVYKLVFEN